MILQAIQACSSLSSCVGAAFSSPAAAYSLTVIVFSLSSPSFSPSSPPGLSWLAQRITQLIFVAPLVWEMQLIRIGTKQRPQRVPASVQAQTVERVMGVTFCPPDVLQCGA